MATFVDWLQGSFPLETSHRFNHGQVIFVKPSGEVEHSVDRFRALQGSYDESVRVIADGKRVRFSGNPTKWVLGHNLYGLSATPAVGYAFAYEIARKLEGDPSGDEVAAWHEGGLRLTRIDLTRMYRPPWAEPGWVPPWLRLAGAVAHSGKQRLENRSAYDSNSVYVGWRSRTIQTKLYDKAAEFLKHPVDPMVKDATPVDLEEYVRDTLRFEVQIRSPWLKRRNLLAMNSWSDDIAVAILDEKVNDFALGDRLTLTEPEQRGLPGRLLGIYLAWKNGEDVRVRYPRQTFYRYCKELLQYGIDIRGAPTRSDGNADSEDLARPLRDYLAGGGLEPPPDDHRILAFAA